MNRKGRNSHHTCVWQPNWRFAAERVQRKSVGFVFADLFMKGCDLSAAELKERDMKHSLFAAAILLSLLLALTIYAQKQTATRVAWEYHVWSFNNWAEATGKLNEDGNQGWELVTVTETPTTSERAGSVTIYLKRAK